MSKSSGLSPQEYALYNRAMKIPVPKGTVVTMMGNRFELLEDSEAHGCPLVRDLATGVVKFMTIYIHYELIDRLRKI